MRLILKPPVEKDGAVPQVENVFDFGISKRSSERVGVHGDIAARRNLGWRAYRFHL
jgi:hypothetical protein